MLDAPFQGSGRWYNGLRLVLTVRRSLVLLIAPFACGTYMADNGQDGWHSNRFWKIEQMNRVQSRRQSRIVASSRQGGLEIWSAQTGLQLLKLE